MNGVTIGKKHSWNDWGLWLLNKPDIQPPEVKSVILDIPGADGVLDLTESLTGEVQYGTRKIEMELHLVDAVNRWTGIYSKISNYLHGRQMRIVFDDDKAYYWEGRVYVKSWKSSRLHGIIALEAEVDPYKYELQASNEPWKWDPFNFETGVIRNYNNIAIDGTGLIQVIGSRRPITPTINCSASGMSLKIVGKNLLKPDKAASSNTNVNLGTTNTSGGIGNLSAFGTFLKAGVYTMSGATTGSNPSWYCRTEYDEAHKYLGSGANFSAQLTIEKDSYIKFWVYLSTGISPDEISWFQLELGSTATDYEPHKEQTYELSQGDNIIPQIVVKNEEYNYIFSGTGNVSVIFRGGSL